MGGAPSIPQINPQQLINAILGAVPKELNQFARMTQREPLMISGSSQAQHLIGEIPGYVKQLEGFGKALPPVSRLTSPLSAALGRDAKIVASGGRMTPAEAASLNAPITAELGQAGMGHTAPGVFTQAMNTYNEMQNRVNTAIGQETQLAPAIQGLQAQDIGVRSGLVQGEVGLQGTGIETALGTEASLLGDYTGLAGMLAGGLTSSALANQQAAAASAIGGANKNAGLETGGIAAIGSIVSAIAL